MRVESFEGLLCVMVPVPKVVDAATGEVRTDRRTGLTVYTVGVCAMRGKDSAVIQVSVPGEPVGLRLGAPVEVTDLEASPWSHEGRSGLTWRATSVTAAGAGARRTGEAG